MTERLRLHLTTSRINDPNLLVLARRHQLRSVPVKASAEYNVRMTIDLNEHFARANIPNHHLIVRASGEQDIERGRMPEDETDASLMVEQVDDRFGEGAREAAVGDLPHLKNEFKSERDFNLFVCADGYMRSSSEAFFARV